MRARTRYLLIWLTYLGFACRVFIPAGYMPAPLAEGGPIILCHGGLSGKVFATVAEERHGHHSPAQSSAAVDTEDGSPTHDNGQHEAWELCPVGATLKTSALTAEFNIQTLQLSHPAPTSEAFVAISATVARSYWPRAPPEIYSNLA